VTAGTIFHRSHTPLTAWMRIIWHVVSAKNGVSAMHIQRVMGQGSYQTAWLCLQKLRRAMVRPGRDRLTGQVEVDETLVGGEQPGPSGRGALGKELVVIAAQVEGSGIGRIRMAHVPDASKATLHGFITQSVEPGTLVHTDGWHSYEGLGGKGYIHQVTILRGHPADTAVAVFPRVHRIASLLKRWLLGTHQGAVGSEHLGFYLDEYTFRFNRRTSASRGKLFYRLIQQAVQFAPTSYDQMMDPQPLGTG
jgi:transposase-like protein